MNEERGGVESLRGAVEAVASDLERRPEPARPDARHPRGRWIAAAAVVATVVIGSTALWWTPPDGATEVEILELKMHGVPVQPVIVKDRAPRTVVVMPASTWSTGRRSSPVVNLVEVIGDTQ